MRSEHPKVCLPVGLLPEVRKDPAERQLYAVAADDFHRIRITHRSDFRIEK
ncbi:hypothetical protein [Streptomyces sp900116325]|uniref:Uncharacterized protein n=1 Tax=Streptomyces sp. 900116325 TaxID=3154295 RepID=A0ABV2UHH9_9ACTN